MWNRVGKVKFVDMILIEIYSGWRPQELAILQVENVDLEKNTMFGGLKTDAGRDRIVPIHPLIKQLVEKRYNEAVEMGSEYLFNDEEGHKGTHMTYDKYRVRFNKVMNRLGMQHRPHETRHTFITNCKRCGVDDHILKRLVGHKDVDITEAVYTHRELYELKRELKKIGKLLPDGEDFFDDEEDLGY